MGSLPFRLLRLGSVTSILAACATASDKLPSPPPSPIPVVEEEPQGVDKGVPSAEAGFINVPPGSPGALTVPGRLFYAFRAADEAPETKPLIVVFNGGPGWATTGGLLLEGTGPFSVDLHADLGAPLIKSARSLTELANVLYVDARSTGFSYELGKPQSVVDCLFNDNDDAADVLRVVMTFLGEHPRLSKAKLVVLGESYAGVRAERMVNLLLDYASPAAESYQLASLVERWAKRAIGPMPPNGFFSSAALAERLGGVVLIQPLVLGSRQLAVGDKLMAADPKLRWPKEDIDPYDVRRTKAESTLVLYRYAVTFADHDKTTTLFGVDLDEVTGLRPSDRQGAWRRSREDHGEPLLPGVNQVFSARLGPLGDGDGYFFLWAGVCSGSSPDPESAFAEAEGQFVRMVARTPVFITNSRYDRVVYTPAILKVLENVHRNPVIDEAARPGISRPGWFTFDVESDDGSVRRAEVRFPTYEAGHAVAESDGAGLIEDIAAWFQEHGVETR